MKLLTGFVGLLFMVLNLTPSHADEPKGFKVLHVAELSSLMAKNPKNLVIYDVNVESTRSHVGLIPGAKLLSSSNQYEVSRELPADRSIPLVFYCANTRCTASHRAAERAIAAGYSDVSVMVDGIYGWKSAGKALAPLQASEGKASASSMEPKEVAALLKKNQAIIVDVREAEERHEVIAQSQWLPMSKAENTQAWTDFLKQLPKNKTIVFHCAAGIRAKKVAERLSATGIRTGFFEGPDQWKSAGLPVEAGKTQN